MATHLIGLLGKKRSGKDTFAARLVSHHGYTRFAFADALRAAALALDPIIYQWDPSYGSADPESVRLSEIVADVGWEDAKEEPEVRRTLQNMGVGVRAIDPDFWVRVVMDQIAAHDGPAVITDVRFPNELAAVRAYGVAVRIDRPGLVSTDTHVSETALDSVRVDAVISNYTTLVALHAKADGIAERVRR